MSVLRLPTQRIDAVAYLLTRDGKTAAGPVPCVLTNDGLTIRVAEPLTFRTPVAGPHAVAMYGANGQRLCEWRFNAQPGGTVELGGSGE